MSLPHIGFELQHIIHLLEHPLAWKHTSFRTSNVARNYIIIALFSLSKSCLQYSKTDANCYIGSIMFESWNFYLTPVLLVKSICRKTFCLTFCRYNSLFKMLRIQINSARCFLDGELGCNREKLESLDLNALCEGVIVRCLGDRM